MSEPTYQQRLEALIADHEAIFARHDELESVVQEDLPIDQQDPRVQQWYADFQPIQHRMYELAYDLGIDFPMGDDVEASAEDYVGVWTQVQERVAALSDGNRRIVRGKL